MKLTVFLKINYLLIKIRKRKYETILQTLLCNLYLNYYTQLKPFIYHKHTANLTNYKSKF